jgi:hypothetical protein
MKMFKAMALFFMLVFALLPAAPAFSEINMDEGEWEFTIKTEMPGMPMEMPPIKYAQCLTKNDTVPKQAEPGQECRMIDTKINGDTVSWVMQCRDKDTEIDSTGSITYRKSSFSGTVNVTINDPKEGRMQMSQQMSGRRIGPCK